MAFLMPMLIFVTTHQLIFIIIAFLVSFGVVTYDTFSKNRLNASSIVKQIKEDSKILDNDDIYTKEAKKVIENGIPKESMEDIKYQEALDKQKNKVVKLYLNYDEIIDSFFANLEICKVIYKIPPININDKEWDIFFDNIKMFLVSYNKENLLGRVLEIILMKTLAVAIAQKSEEITINSFVAELNILSSLDIPFEEITAFQAELKESLINAKVISLKKYRQK